MYIYVIICQNEIRITPLLSIHKKNTRAMNISRKNLNVAAINVKDDIIVIKKSDYVVLINKSFARLLVIINAGVIKKIKITIILLLKLKIASK